MIKKSGVWLTLALFLALNAYDAFSRFGWQDVDLPRTQFFFFSLWVALRNIICYSLLTTSLVFFLGKFSRWIIVPLFTLCLVIEGAVVYAHRAFNADLVELWLDLIDNTNWAEIVGFVSMAANWQSICTLIGVTIIIGTASCMIWTAEFPKISLKSFRNGVVCVVPFLLFNCILGNWHFGVGQTRYSDFVVRTAVSYKRMAGVRQACKNGGIPTNIEKTSSGAPDVIIVIGESATRNNWHLYGYNRDTTPLLDKLNDEGKLIVFKDVLGAQPDTVGALSQLLTDVTFDHRENGNWTLAGLYAHAGFRTVLISQQYWLSDTNSTLYKIFNGCEKRISVSHEFGGKAFDEAIIPLLEKELASTDGRPNMIFVHLAGMHYPVQNVIPEKEKFFTDTIGPEALEGLDARQKNRRNRYDDAIRYEDKVLGGLIDVLAKRPKATAFFFVSDHGESPRSEGWRNFKDIDVYSVPVVCWFSEAYHKQFPATVNAFMRAVDKPINKMR